MKKPEQIAESLLEYEDRSKEVEKLLSEIGVYQRQFDSYLQWFRRDLSAKDVGATAGVEMRLKEAFEHLKKASLSVHLASQQM